jgi:hypothetical protein
MLGRLLAACVVVTIAGSVVGCAPEMVDDEELGETESHLSGTSPNDKIAFDFFLGKGLKNFQAAGIVGNLDQESGMNPAIAQIGGGPGRGIAQWSTGGRWDAGKNSAVAFAAAHGKNVKSLELQLDFIWFELTTFPAFGLAQLRASTTLNQAVTIFQDKYEICGKCAAGNRLKFAQAALNSFGKDAPAGGGEGGDSGEGNQAFAVGAQQHVCVRAGNGDLDHAFWDGNDGQIHHDVWGNGLAGQPATFVTGAQQHAFARGTDGSLEHWFWDANTNQVAHDTWGRGLASDPAVAVIGAQQHAWAVDGNGKLQHWFWDPAGGIANDVWGAGVVGRPSALQDGGAQDVFARGTNGGVEHFWWDPASGMHHDTWGNGIAGDPAARLIAGGQHVWAVDGAGALQHWWWTQAGGMSHDTWVKGGLTGRPSLMIDGDAQHVFVRSASGGVEHYWWSPAGGIAHDTWGNGISTDPNALLIGNGQHVFSQDAAGKVQHWWWTAAGGLAHDTW